MNAELSRIGDSRIILPTLLHDEYVDCQRQLSRQNDPVGLIHILTLAEKWTVALDYSNVEQLIDMVKHTNALERSRAQFTLTMPDGSSLRRDEVS